MSALPVCISMYYMYMHVWCPSRSLGGIGSPGTVVTNGWSCRLGPGNQTHIFGKNKCSEYPSSLSGPQAVHFQSKVFLFFSFRPFLFYFTLFAFFRFLLSS